MADGINKLITLKKEVTWGLKPANTGGQLMPRVTGSFRPSIPSYQSALLNPSQQMKDSRHGTHSAVGNLSSELMCGAYKELFAAGLRRDFGATSITTGALTNITVGTGVPAFTRASGSFLTDGFKRGMIVDVTNPDEPLNAGRALVLDVNALTMDAVLLSSVAWTAQSSGDTIAIAQAGEWTYTPQTGHTNDSFTAEEWMSDISVSVITLGLVLNTFSVSLSPNGMVGVTFDFMGKDFETPSDTRYFSSPAAVPGEGTMSSASGVAYLDGSKSCRMTSMTLNVNNNVTMEDMVLCAGKGARSRGKVLASGSATFVFDNEDLLVKFVTEQEIEFMAVLTAQDGEALGFYAPRMKINDASYDDGEKVTILTLNFDMLEYVGSATDIINTTLIISDTTL